MKHLLKKIVSLVLGGFFVGCNAGNVTVVTEMDTPKEPTFEEIWETEDEMNFVLDLGMYIAKKAEYGSKMDKLSEAETVIYICQDVEMEVNNGGFSQYYYNSAGNNCAKATEAFETIGAVKTAELVRKANSVFPEIPPSDREKRFGFLEEYLTEEADEQLSELNEEFYDSDEDLVALYYKYIMDNKNEFTE